MKNEDFLDDLFKKARKAPDFVPPGEILETSLKNVRQHPLKTVAAKLIIGLTALAALLLISTRLLNNDHSKPVGDTVQTHDSGKSLQTPEDLMVSTMEKKNTHSVDSFQSENTFNSSTWRTSVNEQRSSMYRPQVTIPLTGDIKKLMLMQQAPSQEFTINCSRDTILTAASGTKFHIESQTFKNPSGKTVTGPASLQVKECYDHFSFARENLSTADDSGSLLETGGMYYINALQGADTLSIRPGYEVGITPNYEVPERMDLYYGQRDSNEHIAWEKDPLGKTECPVFISTGGKYSRIMNHYFSKNYKLDKATMLGLRDTQWTSHFTSDMRKVLGHTNCDLKPGLVKNACEKFTQLSHEMALSDTFNVISRFTEFTFQCMGRNRAAFYALKPLLDSVRTYIPESDYRNVQIPLFFAINTGWLNLDCPPTLNIRYKKRHITPKQDVTIHIPEGMRVNGTLYLPEQNSVARSVNNESGRLTFRSIPKGQKAILLVTSLIDEQFYVFRKEMDTEDMMPVQVKFDKIQELEAYLAWLRNALTAEGMASATK
jgi:hypothetical protein